MFIVLVKVVYYLFICVWFCRFLYIDYFGRVKIILGELKWTILRKFFLII